MADKKQNYKDEQALNRLKEEELAKRKEKIDLQRKQVLGGTDPNAYSLSSSGSSGTVQIPSLTGSVLG